MRLYLVLRNKIGHSKRFLRILPFAMLLPYLANTSGWLLTEWAANRGSSSS
jgi:cytochrome bd-type quinol oxidase subunit 1